jgi:phosphatidylinositol-3-phosphatase
MRIGRLSTALVVLAVLAAACSSSQSNASRHRASTTTTTSATTTSKALPATAPCGATAQPPAHYRSVVVFSFENRRWSDVGLGFGPTMPYLHALGAQCSWFPSWTETDPAQTSLTQYVGQVTGARQPGTVNDCDPSATCSTQADNIFRQVRTSGRDAINFVEHATQPCSAAGNAVRHVPALYLWGADDRQHCAAQVRPLSDLDLKALPAFAFITPTTCHDGHDCSDATVDSWARAHVQPVLDSAAYRAGKVAVFIWYDEDTPVPNLWITPTAVAGPHTDPGAGAAATLRAWQSMLDLPCLANACAAPDLRPSTRS